MKIVMHIFKKEFREMMRDKRVRSSALFGPMFMSLMILFMFGFLMDTLGKPKNQKFDIVGPNSDNTVLKSMKAKGYQILYVESMEEGQKLISDGKAKIVVQFGADLDKGLDEGKLVEVVAAFDPKSETASVHVGNLRDEINAANERILKGMLKEKGVSLTQARPLKLTERQIKIGEESAGSMLIGFLPYIIVIWAFYGGISIASDLVAGEKEKGTLETLLISPVARKEIALGKFFALASVCLMSSVSSLVGVYLVIFLKIPMASNVFKEGGIPTSALLAIVALLIPAVLLFASLLLAISTFAKNPREAQTHLTMAGFAVMAPAFLSQIIGFTDLGSQRWVNLVPVLNTAVGIRNALLGKTDVTGFALTVGISLVLALIAMAIAVRLFNREEVLKRI